MSLDKIKLIETKLESYNALLKVAIFEKEKNHIDFEFSWNTSTFRGGKVEIRIQRLKLHKKQLQKQL